MSNTASELTGNNPWYRNRLVWLVIAIPTLTVAGCLLTIFLAVGNPDELVSDYSMHQDYSQGFGRKP